MELSLKKEEVKYINRVCRICIQKEETTEAIVPDSLCDIMRIIDCDATVLLKSKEADNGRAAVSGTALVNIVYLPDGASGARRMEVGIPFSVSTEKDGITPDSLMSAKITAISADAKLLNPRKVFIKTELNVILECYETEKLSINSKIENPEKYGIGIEELYESAEITVPCDVSEKTFIVSDEFKLPSSKPAIAEILKTSVALRCEDVKKIASKVVFNGISDVKIFYRAENGELESAEFTGAFSQIIECETEAEGEYLVSLMLTGVYVNTDTNTSDEMKKILLELHAVAQCVTITKKPISYLADAYSPCFETEIETEATDIMGYCDEISSTEPMKVVLESPSSLNTVIGTRISIGAVCIEKVYDGQKISAPTTAYLTTKSDDGRIIALSKKMTAETTMAFDGIDGDELWAAIDCGSEIYTAITGDGAEIRFPITFRLKAGRKEILSVVSKIVCDENAPLDLSGKPSVVMKRTSEKDSIWMLSKQYYSAPELIMEANGLDGDCVPVGKMLLIPKKAK